MHAPFWASTGQVERRKWLRGVAVIFGQALQSRSLRSPSVQQNPRAPFPHSQSAAIPSSSSGSTGSPLLGQPHTSPPTVSPLSSLIARICSRPPWLCLKSTSGEHRLTVPIRPGTGLCVCFPQASWDPGWGGGDESSVLLVCRMKLPCGFFLLWLGLVGSLAESDPSLKGEESFSDWGLRHLRGSFESVNSYVDSFMELLGGKNGICQYRCRYGEYLGAFSGVGEGNRGRCWVMGSSAGHVCPTPGRPGYQTEQVRCSNVRNPSRQQIPTRSLGCHLGPISPDQLCYI